jgi:hypothetical protein
MKDFVIMMIGNSYTLHASDSRAEELFTLVENACVERKAMWLDLKDGQRKAKLIIGQITGFYIRDHTESKTEALIKVQTEVSREVLKKLKDDDSGESWKGNG